MNIKSFYVEGFRSLKDVTVKLKPLNILIGPNAGGKSNFISAMELFHDAVSGNLNDSIIKKHGGMIPILWNNETNDIKFTSITRTYRRAKISKSNKKFIRHDYEVEYLFRIRQIGNSGNYIIKEEKLSSSDISDILRNLLKREIFSRVQFFEDGVILLEPLETAISQLSSDKKGGFSDEFVFFCEGWKFYYDMKSGSDSECRKSTVARSEKQLEANGDNLIAVLHTLYTGNKTFRKQLNETLAAAFEGDFDELTFPPAEDGRVYMRWRAKSLKRELSPADLSDGTIRFLMLAAILLNPDPPPLVCIDEPELGLHPSMLHIIAEMMKDATNRTQLVVSTHSPQLVSEFTDDPESVLVVEKKDGATTMERLEKKKLAKWLKEYTLGRLWLDGEIGG